MTPAGLVAVLVPCSLFTVMLALGAGLPLDSHTVWRRHWPLILRVELATCLIVPLLGWLGERLFAVDGWDVLPRQVALQGGTMQLVPLLLGLGLRRLFPAAIRRLQGRLDRLANGLLLLGLALLIRTGPLLWPFASANLAGVLLMVPLVLLSLAAGSLLAGEGRERRITAALVTSMRNPGLALLLATRFAPQLPDVKLAILDSVQATVLVSLPMLRRRDRLAPG